MKKFTLAFVVITTFAIGTGCSEQKTLEPAAPNTAAESAAPGSETAKSVAGVMFSGVLPCASCPGITTIISFNTDSSVYKQTLFQEKDAMLEVENGTWSMNGNIVTVSYPDSKKEAYLVKSDSQIAMLGEGNKEVTGELANDYILKKTSPMTGNQIAGEYIKGEENKGYFDKLAIKMLPSQNFDVEFSSGGAKKGCEFKGEGIQVNNRIVVDLKKQNPKMKGIMTIDVMGDKIFVFTENPEYKYDLMYFCGGGGSLAGDYLKKK